MLAHGVSFEERIAAASRASLAAHTPPPPPPPPPPRPSVAVAAGEERVEGEEAAMAAAEALRAALEQKLAQRTAERDEARRPTPCPRHVYQCQHGPDESRLLLGEPQARRESKLTLNHTHCWPCALSVLGRPLQ